MIGYGSLLNKKSLNRTLPNIKRIEPIHLKNFSRSWNTSTITNISFSSTFLGIEKSYKKKINCIIFQLEESYLSILDKREFLYKRIKVDLDDIEFTSNTFNIGPNDSVWTYITKNPIKPSKNSPIAQSYVDTCITGTLEIEEEFKLKNFTNDFIKSTEQWSEYWVNDRIFPRIPHIHEPNSYIIDTLLNQNVYKYFNKIILE